MRSLAVVCSAVLVIFGLSVVPCQAADKYPTFTDAAAAGPDFPIQGEYKGTIGEKTKLGAQVVALGEGQFDAVLYQKGLPGAGFEGGKITLKGEAKEGVLTFTGEKVSGTIKEGVFSGTGADQTPFTMQKILRESPTLGAKPPEGAIVLFDGKTADQWENGRLQESNLLAVGTRTKQKFKNYTLHLEFRTPFMPTARGQARGNSGLYLNDLYEFQILDSFGLNGENNECGGYYSLTKPAHNMCLPPLSWQTYDVDFRMAKFDGGKKHAPAVATVKLNGVVIHDSYDIVRANGGGGSTDESVPGSIFLQDHSNPVNFRNIWIIERN